ncbi:SNF2 domain-containing family protein [Salix suchowensis]|nr:SNF2 domain-containing family protein [Salix suchowensis]
MGDHDDDPYPHHKLCGYLCTVLTAPHPLPFLSHCHLITDGGHQQASFKSLNDVVLSPLSNPHVQNGAVSPQENSNASGKKKKKKRIAKRGSCLKNSDNSVAEKKSVGRRGIGMVNGSVSVVHQIRALVMHKCVKILARVLHVAESEGEVVEVRVVVLVDVYLPVSVWSGWQFPKSGSIAGSLFRHLSCDWEKRRSMLVDGGEYFKNALGDHKSIWNLSGCHVLGCNLRCHVPDSSSKKRFELHEIFNGLPSMENNEQYYSSRIKPADNSLESGIWDLNGDILMSILSAVGPKDLVRVAATCHHLRSLAVSIMPCMKLKLFPHQQAAIEWMLHRERNARVLPHPLYTNLSTEDGFAFHVSTVSGEIITGVAPTVRDFHGGMFCDEPGLGKTITALSLILKTQGTAADPPDGVQITWCTHDGEQRCGYYEVGGSNFTSNNTPLAKRVMNQSARRGQLSLHKSTLMNDPGQHIEGLSNSCPFNVTESSPAPSSDQTARVIQLSRVKRNLLHEYDGTLVFSNKKKRKHRSHAPIYVSGEQQHDRARRLNLITGHCKVFNETWVQCDACRKWRKLTSSVADTDAAWFCSMNTNPERQSCRDAEEAWDDSCSLTYVPGFHTKGTSGGDEQNVSFFISVLKEHYSMINSKTKKALTWLAKLSPERLSLMETAGLAGPVVGTGSVSGGGDSRGFHKIFEAFGLVWRVEKGASKWCYPQKLENLAFDLAAFRIAICKPLDLVRLYLSRATLVVVPTNLVDHWKTQIEKHVKPGQLRLCIWTNHKKPSAHSLAWDYDVVITTFNRLSAEWGPRKNSPLMQVHFLRVMLDEGHTLGSSLSLTNKLQMAMSLMASNRWLLTGTPTPNTPHSQLSHLQPMLRFLQEEAYGLNQKSWEAGILRPFEAEMEEGRTRLLHLLHRCLISSRKTDLKTIPPCIKKVAFLNFTEDHARSYNELVVTVRRNILTADWNDPSHVESLLNPKQWKFRSALIRNIRLSCCVAGHIKVTDAGEDIQETMDMLIEKGLDPISEEHALIKYYLQYGGNCLRCKEWCRLPFITPCRHLLCLDCVALNSTKCTFPGCGYSYEMQSPEILTRPENPNPKWPVPKDLIELQPSYKQDDWDPDWQSTSSSKVAYLVQKLKALQEAGRESSWSIDKDTQISVSSVVLRQDCFSVNKAALEKVIIFSQFLEHIHVIEQQLAFAGIKFAGMYSPMPQINKMKSLATFQHDSTCMALLMDGSAALGLDLSFVTHVFLMEPIWDRSMEEQVISRAHRMGATRPINVETLAMRGTIEEQMLEFLQDTDGCRRVLKEESSKTGREGARLHRSLHDFAESNYLAHLSFVHTGSRA